MKKTVTIEEREAMKAEAIKRMKMLKLHENAIKEFEEESKLNLSEFGGILYWLNEEQKEFVSKVEEDKNILVYHIIHSHTEFGELLSMLYVTSDQEEWEFDREYLKEGYPIAYVANLSAPECSEFGSIGVQPCIGGLRRTA